MGSLHKTAAEGTAALATTSGLVPNLKDLVDLYLSVINAERSEKETFDAKQKELQEAIAAKESLRSSLLKLSVTVAQVAVSATSVGLTATSTISRVAGATSGGGTLGKALHGVVTHNADELRMLEQVHAELAEVAQSLRKDLGELTGTMVEVVGIILNEKLMNIGIYLNFIAQELARSTSCDTPYDAADIATLSAWADTVSQGLAALKQQLMPIAIIAELAQDSGLAELLDPGSPSRTGYDKLIELVQADPELIELVNLDGENVLLMEDNLYTQLSSAGFDTKSVEAFSPFDFEQAKHRSYYIIYLDADQKRLVEPLTQLGLKQVNRKRVSHPQLHWKNLPGCGEACEGPG